MLFRITAKRGYIIIYAKNVIWFVLKSKNI